MFKKNLTSILKIRKNPIILGYGGVYVGRRK